MTPDDKIDKIYDIVIKMEPMVTEHHSTLYGNGKAGIDKQVDRNTRWINKVSWALGAIYLAGLSVIAWTFRK